MKYIFWLVIIVFLIAIGPIATIWALNTLFPVVAIPYTFETWVAVVVVGALFKSKVTVSK
jgi:hypothetical protein